MRKLLLAGFAVLTVLAFTDRGYSRPAPADWLLIYHEDGPNKSFKNTYMTKKDVMYSDPTLVRYRVHVWFDYKTSVEVVSYDVDCPRDLMRKTFTMSQGDNDAKPVESDTPSKWIKPYDAALKEVFTRLCVGDPD